MILTLRSNPAQEVALEALLQAQQDPQSPHYHQWLTPEGFATQFSAAHQDLERIASWLSSEGFEVEETSAGGRSIIFSGNAGQVQAAFRTPMHVYRSEGGIYHTSADDPVIPATLSEFVVGVVSLSDFSNVRGAGRGSLIPQFTYAGSHYLAPSDFATIYNVSPLYKKGLSGAGQTVAIAARTNIRLSDVSGFRQHFALTANTPVVTVNGRDPLIVSSTEEAEALLDVEWVGAVAPAAAVNLVVSATTTATDGATLSADYIVNHNLASVLVMPFGVCEQSMGASARGHIRNLWQQAAAQGITVVVSSGDSGAAACDGYWQTLAARGPAVNGLCSTTYNICVGGTEFDDSTVPNGFWSATNTPGGQGSALQYIPEIAWNESAANNGLGLYGSGGGASAYYAKPLWQQGLGVPADRKRDVPDISFNAGSRDGYLIMINGSLMALGGTSGSASAFAGLAALLNERTATRQGNILPNLYSLASAQSAGRGACFHDIQAGTNEVPGVKGFNAGKGYDLVTGLGSFDVDCLANQWSSGGGSSQPVFNMTVTPTPAALPQDGTTVLAVGVSLDNNFPSGVSLAILGLPAGVQVTPGAITVTASGTYAFTLSATRIALAGAYTLTVTGSGGAAMMSQPVEIYITAPSSSWNLVWSDEFSGPLGTRPDSSKWGFDTGGGGWGNQELQTYTSSAENSFLDGNGNLVIHVESAGTGYNSARLVTKTRFSAQYGRIEARVKLPAGTGFWPGFWMLGADCDAVGWPNCGEIDILENTGSEPSISHGSIHGPGYSAGSAITNAYALGGGHTFADSFHVFEIQWAPQTITFFVDGVPYHTATPSMMPKGGTWVFEHPFYMLLSVAVGGTFPGSPASGTKFPQDMTVDYVRVYKTSN